MRAVKAKACRKLAKEYASIHQLPALDYQVETVNKHEVVMLPDGRDTVRSFPSNTIFLGECERKVYKQFKKANK